MEARNRNSWGLSLFAILLLPFATACGAGGGGGDAEAPFHARRAGGPGLEVAGGVTSTGNGSFAVAGTFASGAVFGPGEAGQKTLSAGGSADAYVGAYRRSGDLAWVLPIGGGAQDKGYDVAAYPDGSLVTVGLFRGGFTLDSFAFAPPAGQGDAFVARLYGNGGVAWARSIAGSVRVEAFSVAARPDGGCVVAGAFRGKATFEPGLFLDSANGSWDVFVAVYAADGKVKWLRQVGTSAAEYALDVATYPDGSFVVTGVYSAQVTFGAGESTATTLLHAGGTEVFVARYEANTDLRWADAGIGSQNDTGFSVAALADGGCAVVGSFRGGLTMCGQLLLAQGGTTDGFVARYSASGAPQWAQPLGGSAGTDEASGVAGLGDSSVVVTGAFFEKAEFGLYGGNFLYSEGILDAFAARILPDGSLSWLRSAGGTAHDRGAEVAALGGGNALVIGMFSDLSVFGPGEIHETPLQSGGSADVFMAHYGPHGDL